MRVWLAYVRYLECPFAQVLESCLTARNMGNFYTNVTVRTGDRQALIEHLRGMGRNCFVSPVYRGFTVVYDRLCDEQDVRDLELLTTELSSQFHCPALATLNHDDNVLWMGLASRGEWLTTYSSDQLFSGSAWRMAREFNVVGLVPLVWFLMRWPNRAVCDLEAWSVGIRARSAKSHCGIRI